MRCGEAEGRGPGGARAKLEEGPEPLFARILAIVGIAVGGTALWSGLEYYVTPIAERPFSPLHDLYAPTGLIGQGFGIVGSLMVLIGVALYGGRKRLPFLARVGKLSSWLQFHIFLCVLGPFLILLHTTFRFGGMVAISFWSMALVVGSGVFGRYVYVWIPKTMNGRFLEAKEVREQLQDLLETVARQTSLSAEQLYSILRPGTAPEDRRVDRRGAASATVPAIAPAAARAPAPSPSTAHGLATSVQALFSPPSPASHAGPTPDRRADPRPGPDRRRSNRQQLGLLGAIGSSVAYRAGRRRTRARFQRELAAAGVQEPARSRIVAEFEEESRIEQQLRTLQPFQRAFRYWHAFHLPLAVLMFVVLFAHVGVAIAFGYTWIF